MHSEMAHLSISSLNLAHSRERLSREKLGSEEGFGKNLRVPSHQRLGFHERKRGTSLNSVQSMADDPLDMSPNYKRTVVLTSLLLFLLFMFSILIVSIYIPPVARVEHIDFQGNDEDTSMSNYDTFYNVQCKRRLRNLIVIAIPGLNSELMRGLPCLYRLIKSGSTVKKLRPVFPTESVSNLYSLVTGLYPESHGIVGSKFFDQESGKSFHYDDFHPQFDKETWNKGTPMWVAAQKSGVKVRTLNWPGHKANIDSYIPDRQSDDVEGYDEILEAVEKFVSEEDTSSRQFLLMINMMQYKANLMKKSADINKEKASLNKALEKIIDAVQQTSFAGCTNNVIASTHGLIEINGDVLDIDKSVEEGDFAMPSDPFSYIAADDVSSAYTTCSDSTVKFYSDSTKPIRLHYSTSSRILQDLILPDFQKPLVMSVKDRKPVHDQYFEGFDILTEGIEGSLFAIGPDFAKGNSLDELPLVDVANLFCKLLNTSYCIENNGTVGSTDNLLKKTDEGIKYEFSDHEENCNSFKMGKCQQCKEYSAEEKENIFDDRKISASRAFAKHNPLGVPQILNETYCALTQSSYVTIFSKERSQALVVSYVLDIDDFQNSRTYEASTENRNCITYDRRVEVSLNCSSHQYLYTPVSESTEKYAYISSNTFTAHKDFNAKWGWKTFGEIEKRLVIQNDGIQLLIITGPIFTSHSKEIPSHVFKILSYCKTNTKTCDVLERHVSAFVIPNQESKNCEANSLILNNNIVTVRDIEHMTGIVFFPEITDSKEYVHMKLTLNFIDT